MIVIGDIHGCAKSLKALLDILPDDADLYSTGDLIDRGSDSMGVVSLCIERGIKAVLGNHEHMLLDYIDGTSIYGRGLYFLNGGMKTMASYDGQILKEHLEYFRSMPLCIETDYFVLTHGGVNRARTLGQARILDRDIKFNLLWNRGDVAALDKMQVFGHTPKKTAEHIVRNEKLIGLNIDTGCVYPTLGRLTAVSFPELKFFHVDCLD